MLLTEGMSIGEKLISALGITLLGMGIVFIVLIIVSFVLNLLHIVAGEKKKLTVDNVSVNVKSKSISENNIQKKRELGEMVTPTIFKKIDNKELIAVIAAAVSAASETTENKIVIRSIKPVAQNYSAWAAAGRQEQLLTRL
ncbi:OadG family protein [Garciella nitratireducens]|uniref:Oxaloacetate decarboxylase, gamma chain n=1 Tax=Garciella nitratireducens DSM 15102 TaxID=1121911 RepID=A0A1T4L6K7_9FIRM|nr:OadG family protein [Garciella nitratireducens]RBP38468.1 oxaloacetate decarboxylase gamma subunit [Garciella nitratireducens]SJZ50352.1 Oxaloacetate decarboxylase, gamma chain [Garciella nitratireducens DSM 15102]